MSSYADPISWPFLPVPDETGQLSYPDLEKSVRDSIRIILSTNPGEQLMRPRFGAGLESFLDQGNTIELRRAIQSAITDSLAKYENRITVDAVDVDPAPEGPAVVDVHIHYRLLRTNVSQQTTVSLLVG